MVFRNLFYKKNISYFHIIFFLLIMVTRIYAKEPITDLTIQRILKQNNIETVVIWDTGLRHSFYSAIYGKANCYFISSGEILNNCSSEIRIKGMRKKNRFLPLNCQLLGDPLANLTWAVESLKSNKLFIIDLNKMLVDKNLNVNIIEELVDRMSGEYKNKFIFTGIDIIEEKFDKDYEKILTEVESFLYYYFETHEVGLGILKSGERVIFCL